MNDQNPRYDLESWRINTFIVVISFIFVVFVIRLFAIQILQADEWFSQAEENRTETISNPTRRGVIIDRNGIILANNIASYNIAITPADLPDDDGEIEEIIRELSQFTSLPISQGSIEEPLVDCGDNLGISEMVEIGSSFAPFQPVLIECNIDRDLALALQEKTVDWPGVSIQIEAVRDYPTGDLTSTFIGFLGPIPQSQAEELSDLGFITNRDKIGYAGVEFFFNDILRGENGLRVVEVDVAGEILRDVESIKDPNDGLNLKLSIDTRLQQATDAILKTEINFWNTFFGRIRISSGVVIAMNPQTGEILSMVSWPTYENNRLARFIPTYYYEQLIADSTQPFLNHAVGAELPAGSVFKIVTSVGALNEGVVTPDQIIETPPLITIEEKFFAQEAGRSREFVDWFDPGFGQLDFLGGISNSSNVYFYKLGGGYKDEIPEGLGICRLGTYAEAMGFNALLGIELPDEIDGLIPDPTWKRINQGENWSTGDTYIASVGQGFIISTPLQVLISAATIANNGVQMRPTVVREITDGEGNIIPIVMDQFGNLIELTQDAAGNYSFSAFNSNGLEITIPILDSNLNPITRDNSEFYYEDGDILKPTIMSPFIPDVRHNLTQEKLIKKYENPDGIGSCKETGELVSIEPWVFEIVQQGMRLAVTNGTLEDVFENLSVAAAGKTGTAEYCDVVALEKNLCIPGNWPTHSWTTAYAPFDNPEVAVVAFLYNGGEGASVAGPVVRKVLEAYFELKAIDATLGNP